MLKDIVHEYSKVDRDKSLCLDANYYKGGNLKQYYEKHRRQLAFEWLNEYIVPFDKTLQILDKEVERGKVGYFGKDSQANIAVTLIKPSTGEQFLEITVTDKDGNENIITTDNLNGKDSEGIKKIIYKKL